MVSSISFGNVATFAGNKLKTAVKDEVAAVKQDIKTPEEEQKVDKFIMTCSDGKDDGKIGLWDSVKAFGSGIVNSVVTKVKGLKEDILDRPIRSVVVAGLGVAALAGVASLLSAPLVSALGTIGFLYGVFQVGKSGVDVIKSAGDLKNARTDAEAKAAIANMGADTLDIGLNSILMLSTYNSAKRCTTALATGKKPSLWQNIKSLFGKDKIKVSDNALINAATKVPTRSATRLDVESVGQAARQMRRINFSA